MVPILMYGITGWRGCSKELNDLLFTAQKRLIKELLYRRIRHPTAHIFAELNNYWDVEGIEYSSILQSEPKKRYIMAT